jgi:hypothetical protein
VSEGPEDRAAAVDERGVEQAVEGQDIIGPPAARETPGDAQFAQRVLVIVEGLPVEAEAEAHAMFQEPRDGGRPERSRRLDEVLTETCTPRSASSAQSASSRWTPWATVSRSDRKPMSSR